MIQKTKTLPPFLTSKNAQATPPQTGITGLQDYENLRKSKHKILQVAKEKWLSHTSKTQ